MDAKAQFLYDRIPDWRDVNGIGDVNKFNAISGGIDLVRKSLKQSPLSEGDLMPQWDITKSTPLLAEDLNCWVLGLSIIQTHLGAVLDTWPDLGIPLFEENSYLDAEHLNQISNCLSQAFRIVFPPDFSREIAAHGDGWDEDPLSL